MALSWVTTNSTLSATPILKRRQRNGEDAMAFQPVPETAAIIIEYLQNSETLINTFYGLKPGGYDLTTLAQLANSIDNAVGASWLPEQTLDALYVRTTVRGLEFENDLETLDSDNSGPGLIVSAGLPNNVTLSVKKSSGKTGRSARGRIYWIGLPVSKLSSNENVVLTAASTAISAAVEAIRVATAVLGWQPVLVSRFTGGVKRSEGKTFPWVATQLVNSDVDSQRRRLIK